MWNKWWIVSYGIGEGLCSEVWVVHCYLWQVKTFYFICLKIFPWWGKLLDIKRANQPNWEKKELCGGRRKLGGGEFLGPYSLLKIWPNISNLFIYFFKPFLVGLGTLPPTQAWVCVVFQNHVTQVQILPWLTYQKWLSRN